MGFVVNAVQAGRAKSRRLRRQSVSWWKIVFERYMCGFQKKRGLSSSIMVGMNSSTDMVLIALSGLKGSGKTTLLLALSEALYEKGATIKGLISPAVFEGNRKTAINLLDLASGEKQQLARLAADSSGELKFGDWVFSQEVIAWGNACLAKIDSTELLIVDEIGPLELNLNQGLQEGLAQLASGDYRVGIMTVRPKCVDSVKARFPKIKVYSVSSWVQDDLIKELLRIVLTAI